MTEQVNKLEQKAAHLEEEIIEKERRIVYLTREVQNTKELEKLRQQLEQLKEEHTAVLEEKEALESDKEEVSASLQELQDECDILIEEIDLAKKLKAYNINIRHKQYRFIFSDRYVERARRVDRSFINFEIDGSHFVDAGARTVHLVLLDPQDNTMYPSEDTFEKDDGTQTKFTVQLDVDYQGEPLFIDFDINHPDRLDEGAYLIEVYIDSSLVRTKEFILE